MRRLLRCVTVCGAALAALGLAPGLPAANAATPITGRLVDSTVASHPGVPNMTVQLRRNTASGPGVVVTTDVTGPAGGFSLTPPSAAARYWIRVVPGTYQGGHIGGDGAAGMDFVMFTVAEANTYRPGTSIGAIQTLPAFVRGAVVDSATGDPVPGVTLHMTDVIDRTIVYASDTTNASGAFRIVGLDGEDFGLRVNGSAVGHEVGWFNGISHEVVPTWGAATGAPLGRAGRVSLD